MQEQSQFSPLEIANIITAKSSIRSHLKEFNMTLKKFGTNMEQSYFVSGGCIGSLIRGEKVNDYDVYFFNQFMADPIVRLYTEDEAYKDDVEDINEKYREEIHTKITGKLITENAITLKNKIQLITKHYGQPDEIRSTFDFVHCMPYYDSRDDKLYMSYEQYQLIVGKKLKINCKETFTKHREEKFLNRGWTWQ